MAANEPTKQDLIDAAMVMASATGWTIVARSNPESKQRWPGQPGLIVARDNGAGEAEVLVVWPVTRSARGKISQNEALVMRSMAVPGVTHVIVDPSTILDELTRALTHGGDR